MLRFMGVPQDIFYWLDLHINYTLFVGILIGLYVSIYCKIKYQLAQSLRTQGYNSETRRQPVHNEIEAKMKAERKMTKNRVLSRVSGHYLCATVVHHASCRTTLRVLHGKTSVKNHYQALRTNPVFKLRT